MCACRRRPLPFQCGQGAARLRTARRRGRYGYDPQCTDCVDTVGGARPDIAGLRCQSCDGGSYRCAGLRTVAIRLICADRHPEDHGHSGSVGLPRRVRPRDAVRDRCCGRSFTGAADAATAAESRRGQMQLARIGPSSRRCGRARNHRCCRPLPRRDIPTTASLLQWRGTRGSTDQWSRRCRRRLLARSARTAFSRGLCGHTRQSHHASPRHRVTPHRGPGAIDDHARPGGGRALSVMSHCVSRERPTGH